MWTSSPQGLGASLVALALLASSAAWANEGRYLALGDNAMVRDDVDVVDFPGLLTTYGDQVFLTVADNANTGDFGGIFGRQYAFGLWVHRTPRFDDFATTDQLFDSFTLPQTHNLVDLMFGMDNGFGLRLSLSAGLDSQESDDPDADDLVSTGGTTFGFDLELGYSIDRSIWHGDFAVGVGFNWFEVLDRGQTLYETGWHPSVFLRQRTIIHPRTPFSWVMDFSLARRGYSVVALGDPETDGAFGRWMFNLVMGPKLTLPQGIALWFGGTFQFEYLGGEVDGQEQPNLSGLGPGLVASGELTIRDTFFVRIGARYDFYLTQNDVPETSDTEAVGEQSLGQRFAWSTGLGVETHGFRFDGTVSHQLYFGGPQFIGGGNPGLMGTISASYAW